MIGMFAVAAGQLMDSVEGQQDAGNKEAEAAPILEIVMAARRHDQRQDGEYPQHKDDSDF